MQPDLLTFIFSFVVLIFSAVIHEVSHGYAAYLQGDHTAARAGRLTLNPLVHLELFGSIILPITLALLQLPPLGWAKPVPYNPYNLRNPRWGELLVVLAGPLVNLCIAVALGLFLRFSIFTSLQSAFALVVYTNLILATFNLVPIPPLDGSKILFAFFPNSLQNVRTFLEKYSLIILLFFIFFIWQFIFPLVGIEFSAITGLVF